LRPLKWRKNHRVTCPTIPASQTSIFRRVFKTSWHGMASRRSDNSEKCPTKPCLAFRIWDTDHSPFFASISVERRFAPRYIKSNPGHILPTSMRTPRRKTLPDRDLKVGRTKMTWSRAVGLVSTDLVVVITAPITAMANATERAKNVYWRAVFVEQPPPPCDGRANQ